jgi:hypothetical protein
VGFDSLGTRQFWFSIFRLGSSFLSHTAAEFSRWVGVSSLVFLVSLSLDFGEPNIRVLPSRMSCGKLA